MTATAPETEYETATTPETLTATAPESAPPSPSAAPRPIRRPSLRRRNPYDLRTRPDRLLVLMFSMLRDEASKPYVSDEVTLHTDQSQKVFVRVFAKLSDALYRSDAILPQVAVKEATTLHRGMDKTFDELYQKLSKEEQRVDILCQSEGVDGVAKYTAARTRTAIIYSPRARRFLMLLEIYDRMMGKLDYLHLSGILSTSEWLVVTYDWRRQLFAYANALIEASNEAMRTARQKLQKDAEELRNAYRQRVSADAKQPDIMRPEEGPSDLEYRAAVEHDLNDIAMVSEHDEEPANAA